MSFNRKFRQELLKYFGDSPKSAASSSSTIKLKPQLQLPPNVCMFNMNNCNYVAKCYASWAPVGAFKLEKSIYMKLPKWWRISYYDAIVLPTFGDVLIITECFHTDWDIYKSTSMLDIKLYKQLCRQLRWLHKHNIAHGDIEYKNLLWDGMNKIVLIDFEKSIYPATAELIAADYTKLDSLISSKLHIKHKI